MIAVSLKEPLALKRLWLYRHPLTAIPGVHMGNDFPSETSKVVFCSDCPLNAVLQSWLSDGTAGYELLRPNFRAISDRTVYSRTVTSRFRKHTFNSSPLIAVSSSVCYTI